MQVNRRNTRQGMTGRMENPEERIWREACAGAVD